MQTFSSSSLFTVSPNTKNRKTECCDPKILMAAGSGMKDIQALIPNVGNDGGRQCGRDHNVMICDEELPVYERGKNIICRERERERHKECLYS